jgi:hypothetical protein
MDSAISPTDEARYALMFACEDETFPVFKQWAIRCAVTDDGLIWAENMSIEQVRESVMTLYREYAHNTPSP